MFIVQRSAKLLIIFKQLSVERESYWFWKLFMCSKMQSRQLLSTAFGGERILLIWEMFIVQQTAKLLIFCNSFRWKENLTDLRIAYCTAKCKAANYLQAVFPGKTGRRTTRVLAIAGRDVGAFGFTSLFAFSSGWTFAIWLSVINFGRTVTI